MATTNYFLICENHIQDDKGRQSIVNIFDTINAESFPTAVNKFIVAFSARLDDNDKTDATIKLKIEAKNSADEVIFGAETSVPTEDVEGNIAGAIDFGGKVQFKKEDTFVAKLFINDNQVANYFFNVIPAKKGNAK